MHEIPMSVPVVGRFITRIEAAEIYLRCHVKTVDRYVAEGALPKYKFGRKTLFLLSDVIGLVIPANVPRLPRRGRACSQALPAALETLVFGAIAIALLARFVMLHH